MYKVSINDKNFTGSVNVKRRIDVNRVHRRNDGFDVGLDVLVRFKRNGNLVSVDVSNGVASVPIVMFGDHGWEPRTGGVSLAKTHMLKIDVQRDEFGGFSLTGTIYYKHGELRADLKLSPRYAPGVEFSTDLKLTGWKHEWRGRGWTKR